MKNFETVKGSIKAKKAANKKAKAVLNATTPSCFGYLVGQIKGKLKVAKNAALVLAIGGSGLFLSSCATSTPMGRNNLVTRQGTTQTYFTYNASGKLTSRATQYSEYSALDEAKVEREYARANSENARAFRTSAQGFREVGRGIEAWRKAFGKMK